MTTTATSNIRNGDIIFMSGCNFWWRHMTSSRCVSVQIYFAVYWVHWPIFPYGPCVLLWVQAFWSQLHLQKCSRGGIAYTWVMFCRLSKAATTILQGYNLPNSFIECKTSWQDGNIYVEYSYSKTLIKGVINGDWRPDQLFGCSRKLLQSHHELIILLKLANIWSLPFGSVSASWAEDSQRAHSKVERRHI
jgi:hypothetical protein